MASFSKTNRQLAILMVPLGLAGGALVAHRASDGRGPVVPLSVLKQRVLKRAAPTWRTKLDLGRARADGAGQLVQRLPDGSRVSFTIDSELQQRTTRMLAQYEVPYAGAVLLEVETGKVRVLAGHSARDPKVDQQEMCLTPWAPAASIFKLVTAAALFDRGVPSSTTVCYHGGLRGIDASHLEDNPARDTLCNTLAGAVAKSINPIMGKLAQRYLDRAQLQTWARHFGFNRPLPFDLPLRPSRAEIPAGRLDRARVAAGFWHTEMSVLHGALIASAIATDGELRWPRIVERIEPPNRRPITPLPPQPERVLGRGAARALGQAMVATTVRGTARRGFINRRGRPYLGNTVVAGKTGSLARSDPFLHYSWFVGFAPAQRPEVAFAVLLGNPERWRIKATTAARMLLADYFALQQKRQRRPLAASDVEPQPKRSGHLARR